MSFSRLVRRQDRLPQRQAHDRTERTNRRERKPDLPRGSCRRDRDVGPDGVEHIVRDDGNGIGFFLLIMAALVGGFSAWFRPAGMARTMLGVAIMQALLAVAIATAPSSASTPDSSFKALLFSGFFHSAVAAFRDFLSCRCKTGSQGGCSALGIGCCAVCESNTALFATLDCRQPAALWSLGAVWRTSAFHRSWKAA